MTVPSASPDTDEFDEYLRNAMKDSDFVAAYRDATARSDLLLTGIRRRKELGLTQRIVAERMKTTQSAVSELEGGGSDARLSTLQRYARAVGLVLSVSLTDPAGDSS